MREGGVEPPHPLRHWILSPTRLPVPPLSLLFLLKQLNSYLNSFLKFKCSLAKMTNLIYQSSHNFRLLFFKLSFSVDSIFPEALPSENLISIFSPAKAFFIDEIIFLVLLEIMIL